MNTGAIPRELRECSQWVLYRAQKRNGRVTKVPYQAVHPRRRASTTDAATWSSFDAAVAARLRGVGDGIGFVFTPGDPFVGVDLDACLRSGVLVPEAAPIVERLPSYTERSPSGTGLHVIGRGEVGGGRRTSATPWGGELEVYDRARFFVMTGEHLDGTPFEVVELPELAALRAEYLPEPEAPARPLNGATPAPVGIDDDRDLLERAFAARNGAKFTALWQGDTSAYPSPSEADCALCSMLAFWAQGDANRVDRLFRSSGLMRPKWEEVRGDSTYGVDTIAKALAGKRDFYEPAPARRLRAVTTPEDALTVASETIRMADTPIVRATEQRGGRVILERADGLRMAAPSLVTLATFGKLSTSLVAAFGHELVVPRDEKTATAHRFVAALRRHFGPEQVDAHEERVEGWFVELVDLAGEVPFERGDAESRLRAWRALDEADPEAERGARAFAAKVLLAHDLTTGDRYLRASWAQEYVRRRNYRGSAEQAAGVFEAIGLERPGRDGRVRAQWRAGGDTLVLRFWVIPAERYGAWCS